MRLDWLPRALGGHIGLAALLWTWRQIRSYLWQESGLTGLAGHWPVRYCPKGQYRADGASWCPPLHRRRSRCLSCELCTMTINSSMGQMDAGRQASHSRNYLVRKAETLALAYNDRPLQVPSLSRALGVSERTLRKLFNEIHGRPPSRHLRMLRLSQVRRALLSARGHLVTVTEIATDFGFTELGRFSVEYRKVFGESPSETLRQACLSNSMSTNASKFERIAG